MLTYTIEQDKNLKPIHLVTAEDFESFVGEITASHKHGKLLLPDDSMYTPKPTLEHAYNIWLELAKHVGIKHTSVNIHIQQDQSNAFMLTQGKKPVVTLGVCALDNNFILAAALAQLFSAYIIVSKHKYRLSSLQSNTTLLQAIAIKLGFGIIIANGATFTQALPHGYGTTEFAHQFRLFTSQNRIVDHVWLPYVLNATTPWLTAKKSQDHIIKIAPIINFEKDSANHKWKFLLIVPLLLLLMTILGYVQFKAHQSNQRLAAIKSALAQGQDKQTLQACVKLLEHRQSTWPSDVFIDRNIQATLKECEKIETIIKNNQASTAR